MKPYIIENEELMKEWDSEKNNAEGLNLEKITEESGQRYSLIIDSDAVYYEILCI